MASRDKLFLDTDVVLDHLTERQPFAEAAHRLLALAEEGHISICVSALTFSNLFYILRKLQDAATARTAISKLSDIVRISGITEKDVKSALASQFTDIEDAIQHFSAKAEGGVTPIISRNSDDFAHSELPVLSPLEYLASCETRDEDGT